MRIPGGALLIALGILFLWVAITGRLDRFGTAWNYLRGASDLPDGAGADNASPISGPLNRVTDPAKWAVNSMTHALDPIVSLSLQGAG